MIKKFFNDIVEFIKEEYKFIIFLLLSVILFLFPVNYYIIVGGDISDIDDRVIISDSYNSKGSFNISYVSELKGRLGPYLLSYIIPGWESESANDYKYVDEETIQDIEFRNRLDLVSTNGNAIKWAYELASKEYKIVDTKVYVISVSDDMPSNLKIGDRIVKFDDKEIEKGRELGVNIKSGKIITSDVFDPYVDGEKFMSNFPNEDFLASEMEAFCLFYLAKKLNRQATSLLTVVDSKYDKRSLTSEEREQSLNDMISLALESVSNKN